MTRPYKLDIGEICDHRLIVICEVEYTHDTPGQLHGPPERCYPPESGDCELVSWEPDGDTWPSGLTAEQTGNLDELVRQEFERCLADIHLALCTEDEEDYWARKIDDARERVIDE